MKAYEETPANLMSEIKRIDEQIEGLLEEKSQTIEQLRRLLMCSYQEAEQQYIKSQEAKNEHHSGT